MTATLQDRPPAQTSEPVLSMTGVSKRFGAVQALSDVSFAVRTGEVVALVGYYESSVATNPRLLGIPDVLFLVTKGIPSNRGFVATGDS